MPPSRAPRKSRVFELAPFTAGRYVSVSAMFGRLWSTTWAVCLVFGVGQAACATEKPPESPLHYTENAKKAYEEALNAYFDRDWEYANQLFQDVKRKWGYSRYARLAELRLADAAYH